MRAEIVRLTLHEVDIKVLNEDRMHVLQWRRKTLHDEVLLDGKTQRTSYGLTGREKVYGLVFGQDENGQGGQQVMFIIDPRSNTRWDGGWETHTEVKGVRLETVDGPLLAYGTLDPKTHEKPASFADWMRKHMGMEW